MRIELLLDCLTEADVLSIGDNSIMIDVLEGCGLETVKKLYRHIGGVKGYIPTIQRNNRLVKRFIKQNKQLSVRELSLITDLRKSTIRKYILEIKKEKQEKCQIEIKF